MEIKKFGEFTRVNENRSLLNFDSHNPVRPEDPAYNYRLDNGSIKLYYDWVKGDWRWHLRNQNTTPTSERKGEVPEKYMRAIEDKDRDALMELIQKIKLGYV